MLSIQCSPSKECQYKLSVGCCYDTIIFEKGLSPKFLHIQIAHQAKYTLWEDGIARKSKQWVHILIKLIDICNVRKIKEDESITIETVKNKEKELKELIDFCKDNNATKTAEYLENSSL